MSKHRSFLRGPLSPHVKVGGALAVAIFASLSSLAVYSARGPGIDDHTIHAVAAPPPVPRSFSSLVSQVSPAVVNISVEAGTADPSAPTRFEFRHGMPLPELFRRFFEGGQGPGYTLPQAYKRAAGSGFIIDPSGHIITNHHVIDSGGTVTVVMNNGDELAAKVLGYDKKTDLALLKVDASELPFVEFGDSDTAHPGDWVIAIGNPFGLGGTVTSGIVSARGRDIQSGPFDDFIQIDASINRGNSGGPLFDANGKVIGINTAIFSPNGGNVGIGFAIPSNLATAVVAELKENGTVSRGHLGIQIQALNPALARSFGLDNSDGALVSAVSPGSPAGAADIRAGDVVLGFGEQDVRSVRDLTKAVAATDPGQEVPLRLWRNGETRQATVTVGEPMPSSESVETARAEQRKPHIGVWLAPLNVESRQHHGLAGETQGVVIAKVDPGGPAARRGLRSGDVITRVGAKAVATPADVSAGIAAAAETQKDHVLLRISRQGNHRFLAVPLS